jgi:hypothetical protein
MEERNIEMEVDGFDYVNAYFDESFEDSELTADLSESVEKMINEHYCNAVHPYAMQMAIGPYGEVDENGFHHHYIVAGGLGDYDEEGGSYMPYTVSKRKIDWSNPYSFLYHAYGYGETEWLENYYMILEHREGKLFVDKEDLISSLKEYDEYEKFQRCIQNRETPGIEGLIEISNLCIQFTLNTYEAYKAKFSENKDESEPLGRMNIMMKRMQIQNAIVNDAGGAIHSLM